MGQLKFKGTQGEWKVGLQNYIKVNEEDPKNTSLICLMQGYNTQETKANAKIIAAANISKKRFPMPIKRGY